MFKRDKKDKKEEVPKYNCNEFEYYTRNIVYIDEEGNIIR